MYAYRGRSYYIWYSSRRLAVGSRGHTTKEGLGQCMASKVSGNGRGQLKVGAESTNSRLSLRKQRAKKGQTDFSDCGPQLLQEVITRIVAEGGLVSFSRTLDGGALVVYVKDGLDENKEYPTSPDELVELLKDLHQLYDAP